MAGCKELRRARRELRLRRLLPGLTCMGGLFGVSLILPSTTYGLDEQWCDFVNRPARTAVEPQAT